MTTYLQALGYLYSDSRIYVNGQPFNASGKVTAIPHPIVFKMKFGERVIEDTIYGFFSTQNVVGARALFNKLLASAQMRDGQVQDVITHHLEYIETMSLAAPDTQFGLYLIAEKNWYLIHTPYHPDQSGHCEVVDLSDEMVVKAAGANVEYLVSLIGAGYNPLKAYHAMFSKFHESGGPIEVWKIAKRYGQKRLVRHQFFREIPKEELNRITDPDAFLSWEAPLPDLVDPALGWLSAYNCDTLKEYMEKKGYVIEINETTGMFSSIKAPGGSRRVSLKMK